MIIESVRGILDRDLGAIVRELEAYPDDAAVWQPLPGMTNTGGTLVLHLCGNLRHFVGHALGGSGYVRDREAEFNRRDVARAELADTVDQTRREIAAALEGFPAERLTERYPLAIGGVTVTMADALIHLSSHLAYHLGQLDYHRRAVTGDTRSVGPMAASELPSSRAAE